MLHDIHSRYLQSLFTEDRCHLHGADTVEAKTIYGRVAPDVVFRHTGKLGQHSTDGRLGLGPNLVRFFEIVAVQVIVCIVSLGNFYFQVQTVKAVLQRLG